VTALDHRRVHAPDQGSRRSGTHHGTPDATAGRLPGICAAAPSGQLISNRHPKRRPPCPPDTSDTADPATNTSPPGAGSADLGYLHPDNLRLGGAGVFAGDWAWTQSTDGTWRIPVGFVGTLIDTWNGWAVFACTREVAEAIVADQQRLRDAERARLAAEGLDGDELTARLDEAIAPMRFDGDDILVDERAGYDNDPDALSRITPDTDGRYVVCGWSWTWTAVDPGDCDRTAGQLPPRGRHQEYVILTHTPDMRLPHDRVQVTALRQMPTHNGVAYTADLAADGTPVGTIENDGNGGPTTYHALNSSPFNWRDLAEFVRGCRRRGQPATEADVLDALVDEFDLNQVVTAARASGATLVRLLDEHGHQLDWLAVRPAPTSGAQRAALAGRLVAQHPHPRAAQWVIWSGTAWRHLTQVDPGSGTPTVSE